MSDRPCRNTPQKVEESFRRWYAAMEASHAMLIAGLRDRIAPDADVHEAYREWNAKRRERKMREYKESAKRIQRRMEPPKPSPIDPSADAS